MAAGLVARLVKAPEKRDNSTPALGALQKIHQHLWCAPKKIRQYLVFTSRDHQAFTNGPHQIRTVATHSGWASLIQRTFAALLIGVENTVKTELSKLFRGF